MSDTTDSDEWLSYWDVDFECDTTPEVLAAVSLVKEIYAYNDEGANAHIVTDDGNVEDDHIQWCLDNLAENHHKSTPEQLAIERRCLEAMLALDGKNERLSVLAIWDGIFSPEGDRLQGGYGE